MSELEQISIDFPKPIGMLTIHKGFTVSIYTKMPNRFHRWMAKVLLGWVYADVGAERSEDWEEPEINPCRGCVDYDGRGGCKSHGGCGAERSE